MKRVPPRVSASAHAQLPCAAVSVEINISLRRRVTFPWKKIRATTREKHEIEFKKSGNVVIDATLMTFCELNQFYCNYCQREVSQNVVNKVEMFPDGYG